MADPITLPDRISDAGVEARILLAECRGPAFSSYVASEAKECMQLMDAVLRNRLDNPRAFGAKGAKSLVDIVRARGQFAGFQTYPNYDGTIRARLISMLDVANAANDSRSATFREFVSNAIEIATHARYSNPAPGKLVAWRTSGASSPGKGFLLYKSVGGNDFYYQ